MVITREGDLAPYNGAHHVEVGTHEHIIEIVDGRDTAAWPIAVANLADIIYSHGLARLGSNHEPSGNRHSKLGDHAYNSLLMKIGRDLMATPYSIAILFAELATLDVTRVGDIVLPSGAEHI